MPFSYKMQISILAGLIWFAGGTPGHAHEGATGIVKDRMDRFKISQTNMKAMANALTRGDLDVIIDGAAEIETWAQEMVSFFPEGSDQKPSEANPAIWTDAEAFAAAAAANGNAARRLMDLALDEETDALPEAFRTLAGTCKACHQKFRN